MTPVRVVQAPKACQLFTHVQDWNALLWRELEDGTHWDSAWVNGGTPDRLLIEVRLPLDLQQADPPRHASQVAEQVVAGLHPLDGRPALLTEARHVTAVVLKLFPRLDSEQIDPVRPGHVHSVADPGVLNRLCPRVGRSRHHCGPRARSNGPLRHIPLTGDADAVSSLYSQASVVSPRKRQP